jgi:hypothetical protein
MKRKIVNALLIAGFIACVLFAVKWDGCKALAPFFGAVALGIALIDYNTDYIRNY